MVVLTMCIEELKNTYVIDGQVNHVYLRIKKHTSLMVRLTICIKEPKKTLTSLMVRLTM